MTLDVFDIIDSIKIKIIADRNWKFQRQTSPPTFGWAKMVDSKRLDAEVARRRPACEYIIANSAKYCDFVKGKISIVVLSCKREHALKQLVASMKEHFKNISNYPPDKIEKILVDNGSGFGLIENTLNEGFFDKIVTHPKNIGMIGALKDAYRRAEGEYILFVEDDFIMDQKRPFLWACVKVFEEYPEIGIIRLKGQNNWWKPYRVIAPLRKTRDGVEFWTWLPAKNSGLNGWCAGSVIFRKASYFSTGELPDAKDNPPRTKKFHQGYIYECVYGREYNKLWLAAKIKNCYPFFQPNLNKESLGWGE